MADNKYPYRPNVAMLVYQTDTNLIWIGERLDQSGHWQFPQGGVDEGSSLQENVIRELTEELGAPAKLFGPPVKLNTTFQYDFNAPRKYGDNYFRGQAQTYWMVPFLGKDSDIDLSAHEPEFQAFRWVSVADVRKLAPKRRLEGYEPALIEFEKNTRALKRGNNL